MRLLTRHMKWMSCGGGGTWHMNDTAEGLCATMPRERLCQHGFVWHAVSNSMHAMQCPTTTNCSGNAHLYTLTDAQIGDTGLPHYPLHTLRTAMRRLHRHRPVPSLLPAPAPPGLAVVQQRLGLTCLQHTTRHTTTPISHPAADEDWLCRTMQPHPHRTRHTHTTRLHPNTVIHHSQYSPCFVEVGCQLQAMHRQQR